MAGEIQPAAPAHEAVWHDVECGAYAADLALWEELVAAAAGPTLELGAGTGRVALALAAAGHEVTALDSSPVLAAELGRRAQAAGTTVEIVLGDARDFDLGRRFAAILAPMQLVHLLGGEDGRAGMLRAAAAHLAPGGILAAALLAADGAGATASDSLPPLPDVRELDDWVFSSLPIEVRDAGAGLEIRRLRQLVSPRGELTEEVDRMFLDHLTAESFEREAGAAGLTVRERIPVSATADHVGSVVCVLEAG